MNAAIWFLLAAFGSWVFVTGWFFAVTHARVLRDAEIEFSWMVTVPFYVFLAVGAAFDVLFNWIWGTIIFRELPKEGFFTSRVKRHVKESSGYRQRKALEWKERINKIQPDHI